MSGARNKFLRAPTRNEIDDIPADARASLQNQTNGPNKALETTK